MKILTKDIFGQLNPDRNYQNFSTNIFHKNRIKINDLNK